MTRDLSTLISFSCDGREVLSTCIVAYSNMYNEPQMLVDKVPHGVHKLTAVVNVLVVT
jgi:hypothetical protein